MQHMNIFDIIGPVMVGPSSSHTAGAVKIGQVGRRLLGEKVKQAEILFHGSFLATGKGHGTDKALVAGLLGMEVDDAAIPDSFAVAQKEGLSFTIGGIDLGDAHPNSVKMNLTGVSGRKLEVVAASVGGGQIKICEMDGLTVNFSGDYPTLIVRNLDQPGHVTEISSMLAHKGINIATMQLNRAGRGENAVMVIECDQEVPPESVAWLTHLEGIINVRYLSANPNGICSEPE
jgi:L-serine dehydratase